MTLWHWRGAPKLLSCWMGKISKEGTMDRNAVLAVGGNGIDLAARPE